MTSLLEKTLSVIAPHRCINCSDYDNILCRGCAGDLPRLETPVCVMCGLLQQHWRLCAGCEGASSLDGVWVAGEYNGELKQVIHRYKFEHARAGFEPLALILAAALPFLDDTWVATAIPTAPAHIRARSFDHAWLLAKEVARLKQVPQVKTLVRKQNVQQRGQRRLERLSQARTAFGLHPRANVRNKKVLVIDDVCTTGATLSAAAKVLKDAGAAEVWGAVVAWKRLGEIIAPNPPTSFELRNMSKNW